MQYISPSLKICVSLLKCIRFFILVLLVVIFETLGVPFVINWTKNQINQIKRKINKISKWPICPFNHLTCILVFSQYVQPLLHHIRISIPNPVLDICQLHMLIVPNCSHRPVQISTVGIFTIYHFLQLIYKLRSVGSCSVDTTLPTCNSLASSSFSAPPSAFSALRRILTCHMRRLAL